MPYIKVDDLMIHYQEFGEGSPLVLLHGIGSNSASFIKQLQGLGEKYRVIAWDTPGYGKSSDPAEEIRSFQGFSTILKGFLEALNLGSVYLLGHSMGGVMALEFYGMYPEYVKALILADTTRGGGVSDPEDNQKKLQNRLTWIDTLTPQKLAKQRTIGLLAPDPAEEVLREAERVMAEVRPAGYRSAAYSLANANHTGLLSSIQVPTLIICGELDKVTPVSESTVIHQGISGSELVIIPGAAHLCNQEKPDVFNHHVVNFLKHIQ